MPVGTKATVKAVSPRELRELGAAGRARQHLPPVLPPGHRDRRRARRPARLHALGRADPHRLRRLPGVQPRGHARHARRRRRVRLGLRRLAARVHARAGDAHPGGARRRHHHGLRPVRARHARARRDRGRRGAHDALGGGLQGGARAPRPAAVGIVQGGVDEELRRRSAAEIMGVGFDAYAIGGLSVGERGDEMLRTVELMDDLLPRGPAALLHGHRRPARASSRSSRAAWTSSTASCRRAWRAPARRFSARGPPQPAQRALRRRPAARSTRPATATPAARSRARTCATSSTQKEMLGAQLLSLHNLRVLLRLTADARAAIRAGRFAEFANHVAEHYSAGG